MTRHEDLTGRTCHHLTAVEYLGRNRWRWRCSCGKDTIAKAADVKAGRVQSCGHVLRRVARDQIVIKNTVGHFDGTTVSALRRIMSAPVTRGIRPRPTAGGIMTWQARIMLRGKEITLGTFPTREEAEEARRAAEQKYYAPIIKAYDEINRSLIK